MDYDKILVDKEQPSYLKELVRNLKDKGHMSVGNWLKTTSTVDLLSAMNSCKELKRPILNLDMVGALPGSVPASFILLLELLCTGEGLDINRTMEVFIIRANYLENYIAAELLVRRGFDVKVSYNKLTLTEEKITDPEASEVLIIGEKYKDQMLNIVDKMSSKFLAFEKELEQEFKKEPEVAKENRDKVVQDSRRTIDRFKTWLADFKKGKDPK